ncbi:hypothetical protein FOZ62_022848 [Perkinsus olseni]|uniref:Uncharacterized protein n=1 Tax=Perkinsus olseni TaxID=32597 RepID=A0A7J6QMS2_PEROL|nr:hypothetical protein FOZ62_022848 [Perkinsus olseni]
MPRQTRRKSTASVATPSREAGNSQSDPTGSPSVVTEGVVAKLVERIEGLSARVEALASLPPTPPNVTPSTPSQRQPLAQEDPPLQVSADGVSSTAQPTDARSKCCQIVQNARKEARQELKTTDFPRFIGGSPEEIPATVALPATSGGGLFSNSRSTSTSGSVRAHLSSFDRLLATSAIAPGSVCSYFLLLYSLSEDVRNRISASTDYALSEFSDVQALVARFQELYRDLRAALLTTYQDVSEAARLRQEWHDLRQTAGSSYLSFLSQVDKFRVELRLQGDTLSDSAVFDKLINCALAPFNDWALQYLLSGTALATARSQLESRAKLWRSQAPSSVPPVPEVATLGTPGRRFPHLKSLPFDTCKRCLIKGHKARDCPDDLPNSIESRCLACGNFGHRASECRLAKDRKLHCDRCGQFGHLCYSCRKPRKSNSVSAPENQSSSRSSNQSIPEAQSCDALSSSRLPPNATPDAAWVATLQCEPVNEILSDDYQSAPLRVPVDVVACSQSVSPGSSATSVIAMLDTGAGRSFISQKFRSELPVSHIGSSKRVSAKAILADGSTFECHEAVRIRLQVPHKATEIWCLVAPVPLAADLILGMSALRALSLLLHVCSQGVILRAAVDRETAQGIVKGQPARDEEPVNNVDFLHILAETIEDGDHIREHPTEVDFSDSILCGFDDGFLAEGAVTEDETVPTKPTKFSYNQTRFEGFAIEKTIDSEGKETTVERFCYGVPWLSTRRLPKPTASDINRCILKHKAAAQKLKADDSFDNYAKVFQRYIDMGVLVRVDKSEWAKVTGLISHFAVLSPSKSTPVRPVLNGVVFRGLIGSGLGRTKPHDSVLRGTLPHLLAFRAYPAVALVDLECAYYQLRNSADPDVEYLFCLAWGDDLFRLISPPMGSPHSAAALQHAVSYMCREAQATFNTQYGSKASVVYSGYMDDLIVACSDPSLLSDAVRILLETCRKYGFHCQPKKCRVGVPVEHPCKVLGLLWNPDDTLSDSDGPDFPTCVIAASKDKVILTRRDVMSLIAQCYDPLGFQSNLLLRMRYILRREFEQDSVGDLDEFISVGAYRALESVLVEFARFPPISRVLNLDASAVFLLFCDASNFGTAAVICDSTYNLVRCSAHLIQAAKQPWSIVRKELLSCLEAALLYAETARALRSVKLCVPAPELYTDNEANYYRLCRAFRLVKQSSDFEAFRCGWKSVTVPSWELKTLFKIAQLLVPYGGRVFHLSGKRNPSDCYSRGLSLRCCPCADPLLIEAVRQARLRPDSSDCVKLSDDMIMSKLLTAIDDDPSIIKPLKDYVKLKQRDDSDFKPLLDPSCNSKADARTLRKYSVVADASGDPLKAYVVNSVTRGLAVPRELRREVCDRLHLYYAHLGAYKLYRSVKFDFDAGPLSEYLRAQRRCLICRAQRNTRTVSHVLGSQLLKATQPWELLGIDLLGPYKQEGCRSPYHDSLMCLLVVDVVTGYVAHAIIPHYAPTHLLLAGLESIFQAHGYPLGLLSDADARFTNLGAVIWSRALGIRWARSVGHASRLNGWHESRHRLVFSVLFDL